MLRSPKNGGNSLLWAAARERTENAVTFSRLVTVVFSATVRAPLKIKMKFRSGLI
jgi:hypothetical protein